MGINKLQNQIIMHIGWNLTSDAHFLSISHNNSQANVLLSHYPHHLNNKKCRDQRVITVSVLLIMLLPAYFAFCFCSDRVELTLNTWSTKYMTTWHCSRLLHIFSFYTAEATFRYRCEYIWNLITTLRHISKIKLAIFRI